jgi:hypothetical protein
MDLPHSDACFVQAYPAETAEAFCDGHNAAFGFFGKVGLTRFGGHPEAFARGATDAKNTPTVFA